MVDIFKDKRRKDKRIKQGRSYWLASEVYKDLLCSTFKDFLDKIISLKQEDSSLDIELTEFKDYILTPSICIMFLQKELDNLDITKFRTLKDFKARKDLEDAISYMHSVIRQEEITDELIDVLNYTATALQQERVNYNTLDVMDIRKQQLLNEYFQEENGVKRTLTMTNNQNK